MPLFGHGTFRYFEQRARMLLLPLERMRSGNNEEDGDDRPSVLPFAGVSRDSGPSDMLYLCAVHFMVNQ